MPYAECPVCGETFHLNVSLPLDEWYRDFFPQCRVGDIVPAECFRCWVDLMPGHRVRVRSVPAGLAGRVDLGTIGTVRAVEGEPGARSYLVEVRPESGDTFTVRFLRRDLSCLLGQGVQDEPERHEDH